jgi:Fe-S cluster biogenesis protein NfuA
MMFIQTETTPNPQTIRFIPGVTVLEKGTKNFNFDDEAKNTSPLALAIFKVSGVSGVFLGYDFITVTKEPNEEWDYLKPQVLAAIMDHFVSGMPVILGENVHQQIDISLLDDITKQIVEIIETRVRPAVAQDGGDITFKSFENGTVYVELFGSCSGCPSSTVTLKNGIENMLKHYIPEVESVESI